MDESIKVINNPKKLKERLGSSKIPLENANYPVSQVNSKREYEPHSFHEFPLNGTVRANSPHRREFSYVSQAIVTTDANLHIKVANDQFLRLFHCKSVHDRELIDFFDDKSKIVEYLANFAQSGRELVATI
jgi:hypothetical protein